MTLVIPTATSLRGEPVLTPDEAAAAIAMAARAPSVHNTQPWKFRICGDVIELLADPDRLLRELDPAGRELMISCGAALFGLRLGLRSVGLLPAVEMLPDAAQPWLAGRVRPASREATNRAEIELAAAVPHRHTHRGAFAPGEVAPRLLAALVADAAAEGAELTLIDEAALGSQLARLTDAAAADQRANPALTAELRRWVRPPGSQLRDGVPAWAIARLSNRPEGAGPYLPPRDFGEPGRDESGGVAPSALAVLSTAGDTPADWLRAGQALHRLLLHAATRWVFARLQSQPLELPRYRSQVRDLLGTGYPHLLLQFGRSNTAPATPRRPQAELRTDQMQA